MPIPDSEKRKMAPIFKTGGTPTLTNRGAAGLHSKLPKNLVPVGLPEVKPVEQVPVEINKIAQSFRDAGLVYPISDFVFDPENARLHPEANQLAIQSSLKLYGQLKPIVVRKETMHVVAGNGTLEAAVALGWTEIAANIVDMTAVEAAGYGLADNRTAELAKWDLEVVARLDRLLVDAGHETTGWTEEELIVLRATDWTEVPVGEGSLEMIPPEEPVEEEPGDAELLMKLKVTIEEPRNKVVTGEVYDLGSAVLVIADVIREVKIWKPLLEDDMLFCPHPGPLLPLTLANDEGKRMLMVQADFYIAGHILDTYESVHGKGSFTRRPTKKAGKGK